MQNLNLPFTTVFPKTSGQQVSANDFGGATGVITKVFDTLNNPGQYREVTVTGATHSVDVRDVNITVNNTGSDTVITMYSLALVGTATSPKRNVSIYNQSSRKVSVAPGVGQQIRSPRGNLLTAGVAIDLCFASGDEFMLYPESGTIWRVTVVRENNTPFAARAVLSASHAMLAGANTLPLNLVTAVSATRYDYNSNYNTGTFVYNTPMAGDYLISSSVYLPYVAGAGGNGEIYINVNGVDNSGHATGNMGSNAVTIAQTFTARRVGAGQNIATTYSNFTAGSRSATAQDRLTYMTVELIKRFYP